MITVKDGSSAKMHEDTKEYKSRVLLRRLLNHLEDVRVTRVGDGEASHPKVFSASSSEVGVGTVVEVKMCLAQHAVIFELGLAQGGAVLGHDDHFGLRGPDRFEGLSHAEHDLAGFDNQLQLLVDVLSLLLHLFANHLSSVKTFSRGVSEPH